MEYGTLETLTNYFWNIITLYMEAYNIPIALTKLSGLIYGHKLIPCCFKFLIGRFRSYAISLYTKFF